MTQSRKRFKLSEGELLKRRYVREESQENENRKQNDYNEIDNTYIYTHIHTDIYKYI